MDGATIVQFKTKMDVNGNSRRCFAYLEHGLMLGVWRGDSIHAVPYMHFRDCYAGLTIDITPKQFKSMCKQGESLLYSSKDADTSAQALYPNAKFNEEI